MIKPRGHASLFDGSWTDDYVLCPGNAEWRQEEIRFTVGDTLWVREAFSYDRLDIDKDGTLPPWYWADGNPENGDWSKPKPSIRMPRWASRITLEVMGVKVERLQDISEGDAEAEGVTKVRDACYAIRGFDYDNVGLCHSSAITPFRKLWEHINGEESWLANPWVVAIRFKVAISPAPRQVVA